MIHLDYKLNPDEIGNIEAADLASATPTQLDYYLFAGDVEFRVGDQVFDAAWGWVPILDFARTLYVIVHDLADGATDHLEFTESEETIDFHRSGSRVVVTASYGAAKADVELHELQDAAAAFLRRVTGDLSVRWPTLHQNPYFLQTRGD